MMSSNFQIYKGQNIVIGRVIIVDLLEDYVVVECLQRVELC